MQPAKIIEGAANHHLRLAFFAGAVAHFLEAVIDEIQFEFIAGLSYALIYTYDVDARVVRWEPREAARGGVRGFARFEISGDKTCVTYALEHDGGRKAAERALDDPRMLVEAFARWMHEDRD